MPLIKICGITNLKDAGVAVEAGADALGFNFYSSSLRYIEPREARKIIAQIPSEIFTVGVFVNEPAPEVVEQIATEAGVSGVQLHGEESPAYCLSLANRFVIKAFRVSAEFNPAAVDEYQVPAVMLDAFDMKTKGGTGRVFDWSIARQVRGRVAKLFLAGGLSPENVATAISSVEPYAIDACSALEIRPGRKDPERVHAFITAARTAVKR